MFTFILSLHFARALSTGGAIAMVFVHSRENAAHIMNVSFIGNTAFDGGAIHAAFNANPADEGLLEVRYEGSLVGPFLKLTNISIFEGEASNNGGAILLKAVPTFFENLTMSENYAESKGGGLYMTDGSIVKMVRSSVINNTATDGGGVMVEKLTMLHCNECIFDDNVAKSRGGGVCLSVAYNDIRPYGHLFDGCSFRGNKGNEGGKFLLQDVVVPLSSRWIASWISAQRRDFRSRESWIRRLARDQIRTQRGRSGWRCHHDCKSESNCISMLVCSPERRTEFSQHRRPLRFEKERQRSDDVVKR